MTWGAWKIRKLLFLLMEQREEAILKRGTVGRDRKRHGGKFPPFIIAFLPPTKQVGFL